MWLPHIRVLQDLIASGAKRVPTAIGSTIPLDLELAIYRKGRETGARGWTIDPTDLRSAHCGQAVVDYFAGRPVTAPIPSVEPVQRVTIEYAGGRKEVVE